MITEELINKFKMTTIGKLLHELNICICFARREDSIRVLSDHEGGQAFELSFAKVRQDHVILGGGDTVDGGLVQWVTGKHGMWDVPEPPEFTDDLCAEKIIALALFELEAKAHLCRYSCL